MGVPHVWWSGRVLSANLGVTAQTDVTLPRTSSDLCRRHAGLIWTTLEADCLSDPSACSCVRVISYSSLYTVVSTTSCTEKKNRPHLYKRKTCFKTTKLLPVRVFYVSGQDDGINFIERGAINEHHMVSEEYVIQKLTINKLNQSKLY